jgi:hypothetical protein
VKPYHAIISVAAEIGSATPVLGALVNLAAGSGEHDPVVDGHPWVL